MKPMYKVINNAYRINFWFPSKEMAIEDIHYYMGETLTWEEVDNRLMRNTYAHGNVVMKSSKPQKEEHQTEFIMVEEWTWEKPRGGD